LLLAKRGPCWVSRDRAAGVRAAVAGGADAVLLDDGLQNPSVAKTLKLVVVDTGYGFGNGRVIPAGPLRENLSRGLARADAVVLLAAGGNEGVAEELRRACPAPVLDATLAPVNGERLAGERLLAFAGIGRPEKFFASLRALGADLVSTRAFADHHLFSAAELDRLRRDAERLGARPITTAKDIVRVPPLQRAGIEILEIEISWPDPDALDRLVSPIIDGNRSESVQPVG
jgi:tetraacyldisaccharide 4'-kinase